MIGGGGWQNRLPWPPPELVKGFVLAAGACVVALAVVAGATRVALMVIDCIALFALDIGDSGTVGGG